MRATLLLILMASSGMQLSRDRTSLIKAGSMETYTDPKLGYSFSYPDTLAIRTFDDGGEHYVYLIPKPDASKANSIPEANRYARAYGRHFRGSPPANLPGKAKNSNGVEHFVYQTITNEGKPSEWKVVVPVDGWTVSFMLSLSNGDLAKTIAESFRLGKRKG
jgi:hypothetical protein